MAKSPAMRKGQERAEYEAREARKKTVADLASGNRQSSPAPQIPLKPQKSRSEQEFEKAYIKPENSFFSGQEAHAERLPALYPWQQDAMENILKQLSPEYLYQMGVLKRPNPELDKMEELLGPRLAGVLSQLSGRYGGGYGAPKDQQPYQMGMQQGPQDFPSYANPNNQIYSDLGSLLGEGLGWGINKGYERWGNPQVPQGQGMNAMNQLQEPINPRTGFPNGINPNTGQPYRDQSDRQEGNFGPMYRENF